MEVSTRTYCLSIQPSRSMKRPRAQDWPRAHMQVPHPHPGHPCACACAQAQAPHFLPIFSYSCPGQLMQAQDFLFPPPLPSPPPSQPAPPLRKYSSGVPRAAQEMLYTPRVSQAIFCPRTRGRLGWEQPVTTQSALLSLFLHGFFFGSTVCSVSLSLLSLFCLCISLLVPLSLASFHLAIAYIPFKTQLSATSSGKLSRALLSHLGSPPLCSQSSEQGALRALHCVDEWVSASGPDGET